MSPRLTFASKWLAALLCLTVLLPACSSDQNNGNHAANQTSDASASDAAQDTYNPCDGGLGYCDDKCVDLMSSTQNCGACGATCPSWNATCEQGTCICDNDSYTYCGGFCIDTGSDPDNCGRCGNVCADDEVCHNGECKTRAWRVTEETNTVRSTPTDCDTEGFFQAAGPLTLNAELSKAAQAHADDMAAHSFLEHAGSDGSTFDERIRRTDFEGQPLGENIAGGQRSPEEVVAKWVDSDGHCANLMNPEATKIGVGYATSDHPGPDGFPTYWVQEFGK